jgi:hypothetical protein
MSSFTPNFEHRGDARHFEEISPLARISGPARAQSNFDRSRHYRFAGQFYCSRSEVACAALMQRYLGFKPRDGVSIQVPLGKNRFGAERHADFMIRGCLLEYHPSQEPKEPIYWRMLANTPVGSRQEFRRAWNQKAEIEYEAKRKAIIAENPALRGTELIVAKSPEEFYEKVILRFMRELNREESWRIPSKHKVVAEFRSLQKQAIDLNEREHNRMRVRDRRQRRAA